MSFIADFFLGKKEADTPSGYIPLPDDIQQMVNLARDYAKRYATETESAYGDPAKLSELVSANQIRGVQQGNVDARMRLKDMLARRGMQNSGVAFSTMRNAGRDEAERIAQINAQRPLLEQEQRLAKAEGMGKASQMFSSATGPVPTYVKGQKGARKGGALPVVGGIAGGILGMAGGPPGIAAGASLGSGLGTSVSQMLGGSSDYNPQDAQGQILSGLQGISQMKTDDYKQKLEDMMKNKNGSPGLDPSAYNEMSSINPYAFGQLKYSRPAANKYSLDQNNQLRF
jgi:hypothetical protein